MSVFLCSYQSGQKKEQKKQNHVKEAIAKPVSALRTQPGRGPLQHTGCDSKETR